MPVRLPVRDGDFALRRLPFHEPTAPIRPQQLLVALLPSTPLRKVLVEVLPPPFALLSDTGPLVEASGSVEADREEDMALERELTVLGSKRAWRSEAAQERVSDAVEIRVQIGSERYMHAQAVPPSVPTPA